MGYADGFKSGFGLAESHFARKDHNERLDKLDARAEEQIEYSRTRDEVADQRYEAGIAHRDKREAVQDERYEEGIAHRDKRELVEDKRWSENQGLKHAHLKLSQDQNQRQAESHKLQQQQEQEKAANAKAIKVLDLWSAGQQPDDAGLQTLKDAGLEPDVLFSEQLDGALATAEQVFTGQVRHDSPQAVSAMNSVFAGELKKGVGSKGSNGGKILSKEVEAIRLGDGENVPSDAVMIKLKVNTDKGSYSAPLTINRSSDPNDQVKLIPIDLLARHMKGLKVLKDSPQVQKIYKSLGRKTATGDNWGKLNDDTLYHKGTGKTKGTGKGGSSGGKPTTNKKKYQEMLSLGVPEQVAKGVAYGTFKTITDQSSGGQVVVDISTGEEIGAFVPEDSSKPFDSKMVWKSSIKNTDVTEQQSSDIQAVIDANPDFDQGKAIAYLKHLNRW